MKFLSRCKSASRVCALDSLADYPTDFCDALFRRHYNNFRLNRDVTYWISSKSLSYCAGAEAEQRT